MYRLRSRRVAAWHRATGVVVEVKRVDWESAATIPVVKFRPKERQEEVIFERSVGTNMLRYTVGERVEVLYDPRDPSVASIGSIPELYLLPLFLAAVGFGIALVGVLISYVTLE